MVHNADSSSHQVYEPQRNVHTNINTLYMAEAHQYCCSGNDDCAPPFQPPYFSVRFVPPCWCKIGATASVWTIMCIRVCTDVAVCVPAWGSVCATTVSITVCLVVRYSVDWCVHHIS